MTFSHKAQHQLSRLLAYPHADKLLSAASFIVAGCVILAFLAIGEVFLVLLPAVYGYGTELYRQYAVWIALYSSTLRHFKFFREVVGRE